MPAEEYKIPGKINMIILLVCSCAYFTLLWAASHVDHYGWVVLMGVLFAFIMVPVYSLIHEAEHGILHSNKRINDLMGRWLSTLFIAPYTFFRHCHLKHHKKNRTDEEMWDLYYEHQSKKLRYGNLYLMMAGFGYLALWLSVLLFAIAPGLVNSVLFKKHTEIRGFLAGSDNT